MKRFLPIIFTLLVTLLAATGCSRSTENIKEPEDTKDITTALALIGPTWQLVKFQSSDGTELISSDLERYTLSFSENKRISAKIDCNRGMSSWTSAEPALISFGPLAMTRAMCPSDPLQERLIRDWESIRSFIVRDGHLYLAVKFDSGIYEFKPAP